MQSKSFEEVLIRFREIAILDDFDMIVAIAQGGLIPAAILNQRLQIDLHAVYINLRDESHQAHREAPSLLKPIDFDFVGKKVLLVDDRIKTGATIVVAKELLKEAALIKTFAVNGQADYALYDETCFKFPWLF